MISSAIFTKVVLILILEPHRSSSRHRAHYDILQLISPQLLFRKTTWSVKPILELFFLFKRFNSVSCCCGLRVGLLGIAKVLSRGIVVLYVRQHPRTASNIVIHLPNRRLRRHTNCLAIKLLQCLMVLSLSLCRSLFCRRCSKRCVSKGGVPCVLLRAFRFLFHLLILCLGLVGQLQE